MKPIFIDINNMSDVKELYESKPNILFTLYIYLLLSILAVVILWMSFGKINIVVKSEGMIRPNSQVATVINNYTGMLDSVNIEDGSYVQEGEILYIVEHKQLRTELDYYKKQLEETDKYLFYLNKYQDSVEAGVNYFGNTSEEEEYYLKFEGYYSNYKMMESDYVYGDKERELNLLSSEEQLYYLQNKLINTKKLKDSISQGKNLFSNSLAEQEYYTRYLKYISDYNNLINQYNASESDINLSTTEEGITNSYEYYETALEGLNLLYSSVEKDKNLFESTSSYSLQYEEYESKREELITAYNQAKENYNINKALEGLAVTEWEVQQSKIAMEEAESAIVSYQVSFLSSISTNITDVKKNMKELELAKDNTLSKEDLLKQNSKDKEAALNNFRLQYMVELDTGIATLTENIETLQNNKDGLELQEEKNLELEDSKNQHISLVEYRNNELRTTISNINTYADKKAELQANIDKLNLQIDSAIVKAARSGVINSKIELVEGDIMPSGTEVLTIIPEDNSEYKVSIYVNNTDIGKLKEGMNVKFNVYALPNSEYGYLTGTVTKISKDLKVDAENTSGYYLVEANLDNKALYDSKGVKAELKAGMACQAQMITENKRILTYALEKIDLWIE
jgi:HlyD family secretion protein